MREKTLVIGGIKLANPYVLAPMAGVTDLPFRLLCREQGAGLVGMEMISALALKYNNRNTKEMLKIAPAEGHVSLQLFGSDPYVLAESAKAIEEVPFTFLDINMGCPMPKIVKNGDGSALLKEPKRAEEIVRAVSRAIRKPVTVKIRKGFDDTHVNGVEMAKRLEAAGASAITVHGRTREQYYSGKADWEIIRRVKEAVSIPIIGNGDVTGAKEAQQMQMLTGCDGVMIGRAARGNPWIFSELVTFLQTGALPVRPNVKKIWEMILRHARMEIEYKGEQRAMREMRSHLAWYTKGIHSAARLRKQMTSVSTYQELVRLQESFCQGCENR